MKQCKLCGIDFEPKNPKGVFCTDACRQKDYRAKIAGKLGFLKKLEADSGAKVVSPELLDQIAENNLPENKKRILKERNKNKTGKPRKFVLTQNGPIGVPELPHERQNNFKEVWEAGQLPEAEIVAIAETAINYQPPVAVRTFRDYMDLIKTGKFDKEALQKELKDDKSLKPNQREMIYSKLK